MVLFFFAASVAAAVDPTIAFSTYFKGANGSVTFDSAGNIYVLGSTTSFVGSAITTPAPPSACTKTNCNGISVTKLNPAGTSVIYSTYFGGTGNDGATGIALDASGNVWITGITTSRDFPTVNPLQASLKGAQNVFISKLDSTGTKLLYSTYLGSSGSDVSEGIAIDSTGAAVVGGITNASDFPLANPILSTNTGGRNGFLLKLNAAGTALQFSTYIAGNDGSEVDGVAVDSNGNALATGQSCAGVTPSPAVCSAYAMSVAPSGALNYNTPISGAWGHAIAVDTAGNAYVTGETRGNTLPVVAAMQPALAGFTNAFVTKVSPSGSLVYSTYLGGGVQDVGYAIAVDSAGEAYVGGAATSANFPLLNALQTMLGALETTHDGLSSPTGFISKISADGSRFIYSTYFGGNYGDGVYHMTADSNGNVYAVGSTASMDFPLFNAIQPTTPVDLFGQVSSGWAARISETASSPCAYVPYPATVSLAGAASTGIVRVNTNSSACSWQATSNQTWLTLTQASQTAIGNVSYAAAANTTNATRTATLSVQGQTVQFTQAAQSFAAVSAVAGAPGGTALIPVTITSQVSAVSLSLNFTVTPNAGAPAISGTYGFQPASGVAAPQITVSASGTVTLTWQRMSPAPMGTVPLGNLVVPIPSSAAYGQTYNVQSTGGQSNAYGQIVNGTYLYGTATAIVAGPVATLTVANPTPQVTWLLPSNTAPGGAGFTLTVNGANFTSGATVLWNGVARTTTFQSSTQVQAAIAAADIASAGAAQITVTNPSPGGGTSSALSFMISFAAGPAITAAGVVNAASYTTTLAGGMIASIFGAGFSTSAVSAPSVPLPTTLGGATVLVDGIPAPLFYVSGGQINFQIPSEALNESQATIAVMNNGLTSNVVTVKVSASAPSIFTLNSQGTGPGAIKNDANGYFACPLDSLPNGACRPASVGTFISIFATGLGALQGVNVADGSPLRNNDIASTVVNPTVTIGGIHAAVTYAGLAPGFVGLYQVNVAVPPGVQSGNAVPVVISLNGAQSNTATIAIQ